MTLQGEYTRMVCKTQLLKAKEDEAVNMLYGTTRTAGREMEIKTTQFKNGIIGIISNVKERTEKSIWQ